MRSGDHLNPVAAPDWTAPEQLARMFSATPVRVAYFDAGLRLRMATDSWGEWFDCAVAQAVGRTYAELAGSARAASHRVHFERARGGGSACFDDERVELPGVSRWCTAHLAPGPGEAGGEGACGVLMVLLEVTAERARDEVISRQREQLFAQFRDRQCDQDVQAELAKTRTLLDWRTALLTERNEMLQLLSHEIRQPLNNASAAMQATMKAIEDLHLVEAVPASTALARAEMVLGQVIGTLDNALAAGTILALGDGARLLSDTDLPTLVKLVLADLAADLRPRVAVEWVTGTRTVRLHPTLMRLTLRNLLNNALAYSPADSTVLLRIAESDEPLALVIEVRDNGSGIPADLRPRLFEKGARGTNSRLRSGAGLGLYIVRAVTTIHRGDVEALPNEPTGTIMRLTLPQGLAD